MRLRQVMCQFLNFHSISTWNTCQHTYPSHSGDKTGGQDGYIPIPTTDPPPPQNRPHGPSQNNNITTTQNRHLHGNQRKERYPSFFLGSQGPLTRTDDHELCGLLDVVVVRVVRRAERIKWRPTTTTTTSRQRPAVVRPVLLLLLLLLLIMTRP